MALRTPSVHFFRRAHRSTQIGLVILIFAVTQAAMPEWIKALEATAWLFVGYMLIRLMLILLENPCAFIYQIPDHLRVPDRVTKVDLPQLANSSLAEGDTAVWQIIVTLRLKIQSGADEASVHTLMNERMQNLRSQAYARFSDVSRELNTLAFEGIIGTLLGMMVFMGQASKLLTLPGFDNGDTSALATVLLKNLQEIDFLVVLSAFITSVIGWTAKAWIGRTIDHRRDQELISLIQVEAYLQTRILSRLSLPTRTMVEHTLTMDTWSELIRGQLRLRVQSVDGGFLLVPEVPSPSVKRP